MNSAHDTSLGPRSEAPRPIEAVRPPSPVRTQECCTEPLAAAPHAHGTAGIHARCVACGATASDWRRLLGVGARLADCAMDASRIILDYPGACAECGSREVLVSAA